MGLTPTGNNVVCSVPDKRGVCTLIGTGETAFSYLEVRPKIGDRLKILRAPEVFMPSIVEWSEGRVVLGLDMSFAPATP